MRSDEERLARRRELELERFKWRDKCHRRGHVPDGKCRHCGRTLSPDEDAGLCVKCECRSIPAGGVDT